MTSSLSLPAYLAWKCFTCRIPFKRRIYRQAVSLLLKQLERLSSITIPPFCKVIINPPLSGQSDIEEFLPTLSWAYNHFRPPISPSGPEGYQNYWRSLRLFIINGYVGVQGYIVEENLTRNDIIFELCLWSAQDE